MNQQEALQAAQEAFPHIAEMITLERKHRIGHTFGLMDEFTIWIDVSGRCRILGSSYLSWDHALAMAKANETHFAPDNSPVDEPAEMQF